MNLAERRQLARMLGITMVEVKHLRRQFLATSVLAILVDIMRSNHTTRIPEETRELVALALLEESE